MYQTLFENQETIFKVIANQKRLEIIQLLTHGELAVNEMVNMLGISQSNVSQHLKLLRQAGVVETRRDGTTVYYHLSNPKIAEACSLIRKFLIEQNVTPGNTALNQDPARLYPLVQDVVCGMRMALSESSEKLTLADETFYFCAAGCKDKFEQNPKKYTARQTKLKET